MNDVEEQILSYPHLPDEKKRAVEAYVEEHPEWAPLLRDVRALESVGRDEVPFSEEPLLVAYVVAQHLQFEVGSTAMAEAFEAFEDRMEADVALRERVEAARRRLRSAEAKIDPASQFEALTDHSLTAEEASTSASAPAVEADRSSTERGVSSVSSFVDRVMALPIAVRGLGAAVVVLLGTYVALFVASTASQSPLGRLATVEVSEQMMESYYSSPTTRSATPTSDTAQVGTLYLDALSTLREARTSTLGLFPSYDSTALRRAETQLSRVLERTEADSFLGLEVQFYLGKTYLAQERVDSARARFEAVVENEGRRAEEARRILRDLQDVSLPSGGGR
jgi:TolA-binding protein